MAALAKVMMAIICILGLFCATVRATPNTNVTQVLCNGNTYTSGDPFNQSLSYVLDDLQEATPSRKDHDYYNISPFPIAFAYGHASCGLTLSTDDCTTCLLSARKSLFDACVSSIGARVALYDCAIRYEQYPFTN